MGPAWHAPAQLFLIPKPRPTLLLWDLFGFTTVCAFPSPTESLAAGRAFTGSCAEIVGEIYQILREISADRTTVLLMEQNIKHALKVSSYAYMLETRMIMNHGPTSELRNDPKIVESYLGGGWQA